MRRGMGPLILGGGLSAASTDVDAERDVPAADVHAGVRIDVPVAPQALQRTRVQAERDRARLARRDRATGTVDRDAVARSAS